MDDTLRTDRALRGIEGKRLRYRRIGRPDPRHEARVRRRAQKCEQPTQLELFPDDDDLGRICLPGVSGISACERLL